MKINVNMAERRCRLNMMALSVWMGIVVMVRLVACSPAFQAGKRQISSALSSGTSRGDIRGMGGKVVEIKFLGRGGQGVVVASEILARAGFEEGMYPQSYSLFGAERRGAPVAGFVRVSDKKIYLKCDVDRPNHLALFDKSLCNEEEINAQVIPGGYVLLNGDGSFRPGALENYKIGRIDALEIAKKHGLGSIVNTAILGAYVRLTEIVTLETLIKVIGETISTATEANIAAAKEAYEKATLL